METNDGAIVIGLTMFIVAIIICWQLGVHWKEVKVLGSEQQVKLLQLGVFFQSLAFTTPVMLMVYGWHLWPTTGVALGAAALTTILGIISYRQARKLTETRLQRVQGSLAGDWIEGVFGRPITNFTDAVGDCFRYRNFGEWVCNAGLVVFFITCYGFVLTCVLMRPFIDSLDGRRFTART